MVHDLFFLTAVVEDHAGTVLDNLAGFHYSSITTKHSIVRVDLSS